MLSSALCSLFSGILVSYFLNLHFASAKTQFLFENDEGSPSITSHSGSYRQPASKTNIPSTVTPQNLQFEKGANRDVIHIIDPPFLKTNKDTLPSPQYLRHIPKDHTIKFRTTIDNNGSLSNSLMSPSYQSKLNRPTPTFFIKPQQLNRNNLVSPQQEINHHNSNQIKKAPSKLTHFSKSNPILPKPVDGLGYHFGTPQFYPLKVNAAIRHKHITRSQAAPFIPHAKHRIHFKNFKTFQSNIQQKSLGYEEQGQQLKFNSFDSNVTSPSIHTRPRRDTNNARHKSGKIMRGNLLPVALTIMGENGELLTGRALLQHITVLLKNASAFESNDSQEETDFNKFVNKDVLLNEKEFHRIMDNSMNLTDSVMLTVMGNNALNDSSLLTNAYVNEYLNCIDATKTTNGFKALQRKIDCMKHKMFDRNNFDPSESSQYSISNLPAALVYNDVMSNIKNLVRPINGIAFYSLPVDELTHLQSVVLPIEDYVTSPQVHTSQYEPPSSYQNRKIYFNERNTQPRMPLWYVVKSDGRIYQMEAHHRSTKNQPDIFYGFPDIPNADIFVDRTPRVPFFETVFFDE